MVTFHLHAAFSRVENPTPFHAAFPRGGVPREFPALPAATEASSTAFGAPSSRISGSAVLESEVPPDTMPSNRVITHMATTLIPYMLHAFLHIESPRRYVCQTGVVQFVFLQLLANKLEFCTSFHKELQMAMYPC
ncbi:hypothetical protein LXL04_005509 [Taraxacum kok-saghyz]